MCNILTFVLLKWLKFGKFKYKNVNVIETYYNNNILCNIYYHSLNFYYFKEIIKISHASLEITFRNERYTFIQEWIIKIIETD